MPAPDARPLLIFQTGATHEDIAQQLGGDFIDWIRSGLLAGGASQVDVLDVRTTDAVLPDHGNVAGVIITGSHAMVSDREPWSEALVPWLQQAVRQDVPVLGICYGHQLLAHAMGGEVGHHPEGPEFGTVEVARHPHSDDDPLLGSLPRSFPAQAAHFQSVRKLPEGAVPLASNAFEPYHAFRIGRKAWGVQFHPEFGPGASRAYLELLHERLGEAGLNPDHLIGKVSDSPEAASVLPRFAKVALAG